MTDSYIILEICTNTREFPVIGKIKQSTYENFIGDINHQGLYITNNGQHIWVLREEIQKIITYESSEDVYFNHMDSMDYQSDIAAV